MRPHAWTLESLERACRKAVQQRASIRLAALPVGYDADVEGAGSSGKLRMRHDPHKGGLIETAVHEAIHDVLADVAEQFDDSLEEIIVTAVEAALVSRIMNSKRRLAWWRKATSGRLKK
jgi:hypothetical protein